MNSPIISVVIPAYNQAEYLGRAIESVLKQTLEDFEIIVINDKSTDDTEAVVREFSDPRISYLSHDTNMRLPAARNTGMRAARAELIAFLDADDLFHPAKLEAHAEFLAGSPEVGVSYNSRFELDHSADTIREVWRPPLSVGLSDLVLGFPFAPSDMVVRREWAFKVGLFDPGMGSAEDTDFPCRLALAGCRFGGIDRVLNFRRYHSGRGRKNLPGRIDDVKRAQAAVFADPRCPEETRALKPLAIKHHLMVIVSLALIQDEAGLSTKYIKELVDLDPSVIQGSPCELVEFMLWESIADNSVDHETLLGRIFSRLPGEIGLSPGQFQWAVSRGWLWKALRAMIWGRVEEGRMNFEHAVRQQAVIDENLIQLTTHHLLACNNAWGSAAAVKALKEIEPYFEKLSKHAGDRLAGSYHINRAFEKYHLGENRGVPGLVLEALGNNPAYIANRGVISVFLRSLIGSKT